MHIEFKIYKESISIQQAPLHKEHDPSLPHLYMIPDAYKTTKHTLFWELEACRSVLFVSKGNLLTFIRHQK